MPRFTSPVDGTSLFYRYYVPDGAEAHPVTLIFLHGWPMSSRMFDQLYGPLIEEHHFRVIAPDRRGFGLSDYNNGPLTKGPVRWSTFVADLTGLLEHLDVGRFVFVAASMGGPESVLTHLASEFVRDRCEGFVWLGANMPYNVQCDACPAAPPAQVWDHLVGGLKAPTGKAFIAAQVPTVFRSDLPSNVVDQRTLQFFERLVAEADPMALQKTPQLFREPLVEELRRFGEEGRQKPILVLHGEADDGMPVDASANLIKKMLPWSDLRLYKDAGHGLYLTHADQVMADLLEFMKEKVEKEAGTAL